MNEALREYTTSIGFNLTLSKRQIELLVLMDYFEGHSGLSRAGRSPSHYVTTMRSLERRGLTSGFVNINKAGHLVCSLLKEAGIYQDVLDLNGIQNTEAA
ncbi:hypothetical protein GS471_17085 [Rhodococcus hoagii]|nr:hypothetical protein [Prescottella equi]